MSDLIERLKSLRVLLGIDSPETRGWAPAVQQEARRTIDAVADELERLRAERGAYKRDLDAELAGNAALRAVVSAADSETFPDAVARVVAERDALRKRATCKCGDEFTEHDPGTCGNCLAAITAGTDALRADAERLQKELEKCRQSR